MLRSFGFPSLLASLSTLFAAVSLAAEPTKSDKPEAHPASNDITPTTPGKYVDGRYIPPIAAASKEGENNINRIIVPKGFNVSLFAAEPMVANPVSFCFDERGRVFVCETFRQKANKGVEDNRKHPEWLNEDIAANSVEDRLAYIKKHRPDQGAGYAFEQDRLRLLEDRDGDGVADHDTVYADGFRDILTGTGAGVLAHKGNVYYTCIPDLWKLRDTNNDGVADEREKLSSGYGVKFAFRGHDMHGLVIGPDGRLYWSIGDRGLNVKTKEGKHLYAPDTGAVLRSELDGSNTEIFCTGLRNPQELAFDDYGNLFTVDNNSDSGDRARLYHLVQGGDYGWRMYYQYLPDRGPWNREKLWGLAADNLSMSVIPPIAHITDGPSGLVAYPGTGLPAEYNGSFFVCDFRGGPANSAVQRFTMEPDGASFKMTKYEPFLQKLLVTDCDFGPDGAFYVSDWVDGWDGLGKGRIYRITNETLKSDPRVKGVQTLLKEGFDKRDVKELRKLLEHADRRVRMGAQFALVEKNSVKEMLEVAKHSDNKIARLHAAWGAGQWLRTINIRIPEIHNGGRLGYFEERALITLALDTLSELIADRDQEFAAQVVKSNASVSYFLNASTEKPRRYLTEAQINLYLDRVRELLKSDNPKVVLNAKEEYRLKDDDVLPLLDKFFDQPVIRNTIAKNIRRYQMGRHYDSYMGNITQRWKELPLNTKVALSGHFKLDRLPLKETDPRMLLENVRYLHDSPRELGWEDVSIIARLIAKPYSGTKEQHDALYRRILVANYLLGQPENAEALAVYAGHNDAPEKLRIEALDLLLNWHVLEPIDRVTGRWLPIDKKPLPARPGTEAAAKAITAHIGAIFSGPDKVRQKAAEAAGKLGIKDIQPQLLALLGDKSQPGSARAAALQALGQLGTGKLDDLAFQYQGDKEQALRLVATELMVKSQPENAVSLLNNKIEYGPKTLDIQQAIELLRDLQSAAADEALVDWCKRLNEGLVNAEIVLDLVEAARDRVSNSKHAQPRGELDKLLKQYLAKQPKDEKLAPWLGCIAGGNAERGEQIFYEKIAVSCVRCHKIDERGGDVGPVLSKIGKDKTRQYLLEAIVDPNRAVAQGFETVVIETNDGQVLSGIIKKETPDEITLVDATAKVFTVKTADIDSRQKGQSSMPEDVSKLLTPFEVRDLVEFLSGKK